MSTAKTALHVKVKDFIQVSSGEEDTDDLELLFHEGCDLWK